MPRLLAVLLVLLLATGLSTLAFANGAAPPSTPAAPSGAGAGPAEEEPMATPEVTTPQEPSAPQMQEQESAPATMGAGPCPTSALCPSSVAAVDNNSIYVVQNNQLLQFRKRNMEFLCGVSLPQVTATSACPPAVGTSTCPPAVAGAGSASLPCPASSVAVDGSSVFVMQGNQLMKFRKDNLQIISSVILPPMANCPPASAGAGPGSVASALNICPNSSLSVDNNSVFLIRGNQLLQFRKDNMQLVCALDIPLAQGCPPVVCPQGRGPCAPTVCPRAYPPIVTTPLCPTVCAAGAGCPSGACPAGGCTVSTCPPGYQQVYPSSVTISGSGPAVINAPQIPSTAPSQQVTPQTTPSTPSTTGQGTSTTQTTTQGMVGQTIVTNFTDTGAAIRYDEGCPVPTDMSSTQAEQYLLQNYIKNNAGAIRWSQLAVTKASRPELRAFAQCVINAAVNTNNQLVYWMQSLYCVNVAPFPQPTPYAEQVYCNLESLSDCNFDIAYMQAMIRYNENTMQLSRSMRGRTVHPELGRYASALSRQSSKQNEQLRNWLASWYNVCP